MAFEKEIKKTNAILAEIESIDKKRLSLMEKLQAVFPVKVGEKVSIVSNDEEEKHIRFAFITEIKVKLIGKEKKARIQFDLQKCKADGTMSQHETYLRYNEIIKKIK